MKNLIVTHLGKPPHEDDFETNQHARNAQDKNFDATYPKETNFKNKK